MSHRQHVQLFGLPRNDGCITWFCQCSFATTNHAAQYLPVHDVNTIPPSPAFFWLTLLSSRRKPRAPKTQSPALAVEFMEVSGDLLVSSSSGMCCIPPSRWCPLRLLVAKERADRRAAAAAASSRSSSRSRSSGDGVSRQALGATPIPTHGEGFASTTMMQANGTTVSERGVRAHGSESAAPHELTLSKQRSWHAGEGRGGPGDRQLRREGVQVLDGDIRINGKNDALLATRKSRGRAGDIGGDEEEPSEANDDRGCTSPAVAGAGDGPEIPAPSRLKGYLTPRKATGRDPGDDRRKFSILDRMKAKFSSMPTSPPPPTPRTTKVGRRPMCSEFD